MTSPRRILRVPKAASHGILLAACLSGALASQPAAATCPPGYRPKGPMCMPGPVKPQPPYTAHSVVTPSVSAVHAGHQPGEITEAVDPRKIKPQPGAPIEHSSTASEKRGIIFVGGKKATVAPATSSGHAALNTQPIPPGHAISVSPHPGAPLEKAGR